jgi:threonine aldolase
VPPGLIDLRSDTVTRPSQGMRAAMAAAEVGDDQFGDDPTVNRLQDRLAEMLGKEAALWFPTGTMANQVVLRSLTRPGDDVIVSREAHAVWHETGGSAANAGVQLTELGGPGWFSAAEFEAAVKPRGHLIYPPTTLVEVENTHNRAGGVVVPPDEAAAVAEAARRLGIMSYLDGARLWNAAVVSGRSVAELAAPFDVAMVSLSKGLGAPGGSVVAAPRELLATLVRYRRMSGGAMRQVGIFAAAGLWALDHNLDRLAEDHADARTVASRLGESAAYVIDPAAVQTNILVWSVAEDVATDAPAIVERARERGVLIFALGPRTFRAVTHLDVTAEECAAAAAILVEVAET